MKELNEKEIREKIRHQLEEELVNRRKTETEDQETTSEKVRINESVLWEEIIKQQIEEEVYGSHSEFFRCINHLDEISWLTSPEIAESYEYYVDESGRFKRFLNRMFSKRYIPKDISEKLKNEMDRYKQELEADAQHRISELKKKVKKEREKPKKNIGELETKILEEETDRFYRKMPGYKKYINHLDEIKWMTNEEFLDQNEYMEEVLTPWKIFYRRSLKTLSVLIPLFLVWYFFIQKPVLEKSFLMITIDQGKANLYINKKLAVGYQPNNPFPLLPGEYAISLVSKEYSITPAMKVVILRPDDTTTVSFKLKPKELENSGIIRIKSTHDDANVFIDNEFQGKILVNSQFILSTGKHLIALEKEDYIITPTEKHVEVNSGDTLDISFRLAQENLTKKSSSKKKNIYFGIIEVNSNINDAVIYLDGKKTQYKTDHVFQRIPFGQHKLKIEKEGYKAYPEEKLIKLEQKNKNIQVNFTLTSLFHMVRINTSPVKGNIFIDGEKVGTGLARISLPLGKHTIHFGAVKHHKTPEPKEIVIDDNSETEFYFTYQRDFYIKFLPNKVLPDVTSGSINTGYLNEKGLFVRSKSPGPDIIDIDSEKSKAWSIGYAYQYRNPPGSDAIEVNFMIPENIDLSSSINLRLYIYNSGKNYPLAVGGKPSYQIMINNRIYKKNLIARTKQSELNNSKYEEFLINHMLRKGFNKIRISTNDNTTAFLTLWKVVIQ